MTRIRWQMVREDGPVVEPFKDAADVSAYLIRQGYADRDRYVFISKPLTRCPRRAEKARCALRMGGYRNDDRKATPEDVVDILADLRHWCDKRGWDFGDLDRSAYRHYIAERGVKS